MWAPVWNKKWHNDVFTSYDRSQYCIKKAKIMSHNRITIVLPPGQCLVCEGEAGSGHRAQGVISLITSISYSVSPPLPCPNVRKMDNQSKTHLQVQKTLINQLQQPGPQVPQLIYMEMSTPVSWDTTLGYSDWPSIPAKIRQEPGQQAGVSCNNTEWQKNI